MEFLKWMYNEHNIKNRTRGNVRNVILRRVRVSFVAVENEWVIQVAVQKFKNQDI